MQQLDPDLRALQEVRDMVARARRACEAIHDYDQARADALCAAMAKAGAAAAYDLARLAVEETGIGRVHYKILKNLVGSEGAWDSIKHEKTVGIVSRDERKGIIEVATASGVIAGIIPTTNPTSTALFKAIIAVKGKNAIVISPHPRARRCIGEAVEVLRRAIERAGGPPDLVLSLSNPTIESTGALMKHKDVALILATGGTGLVQAAYSSGKPAYGVGPGNVPVYIDRSADVAWAAQAITASQSFDNATLCCSEQGVVLDKPIAQQFIAQMKQRGAHLCDEQQTAKLAALCNKRGHMNPDVVGIDPWRIAEMAGFSVPEATSVLLAHQGGVGKDWPLSIEILAPVLSLHIVDGWKDGCRVCIEMLEFDGLGHTLGIHARDEQVLEAFFLEKPANRILVNGPCSQGAVGYSTQLVPSMSLGCGPQAGNITSDNITAKHLVNIKRVAYLRRDWREIEKRDHARAAALMQREGEYAPRGSGLPGDPALALANPRASSSAFAPGAASNWQGNPSMQPSSESRAPAVAASPMRSKVEPALKSSPPPTFTRPMAPSIAQASGMSQAPSASQASASAGASPSASGVATLERPASSRYDVPHGMADATSIASAARGVFTGALANPGKQASAMLTNHNVGAKLSTSEIQVLMSHAGAGCPLGPCKGCPHHVVTTGACSA